MSTTLMLVAPSSRKALFCQKPMVKLVLLVQIRSGESLATSSFSLLRQMLLFLKVSDAPETCCAVCIFKEHKLKKEESSALYITVYTQMKQR
jgi:hypothetical protein